MCLFQLRFRSKHCFQIQGYCFYSHSDPVLTMPRPRRGRGRSDSGPRSDRSPIPRRRSRTRRKSLVPLRGYCRITELQKANAANTRMAAKLSQALDAESRCRKRIDRLRADNDDLETRLLAATDDLAFANKELALDEKRRVSLMEVHNDEQDDLRRQLSAALKSKNVLQELISELAQRARDEKLFGNGVVHAEPLVCGNSPAEEDLSGPSPFSAEDDSMDEPAVTVVASQSKPQIEAAREDAAATNGVRIDLLVPEQLELSKMARDEQRSEKDIKQDGTFENSARVSASRSCMPSPCGEPRAIEVGSAFAD